MIEFHEVKDILPNWVFCKRAEFDSGNIIIGVTPVLFGMRVRAGYENDSGVNLDYCAGADQDFLERLYFIIERALILTNGNFDSFPTQYVKPVILDKKCYSSLLQMIEGDFDEDQIPKMPSINELRKRFNIYPLVENKEEQDHLIVDFVTKKS